MRVDCSMERLDASTICHVGALSFHQAMFHLSKVACSNGLEQRHQEVSASRDCKNADADSGGRVADRFQIRQNIRGKWNSEAKGRWRWSRNTWTRCWVMVLWRVWEGAGVFRSLSFRSCGQRGPFLGGDPGSMNWFIGRCIHPSVQCYPVFSLHF